MWVFGYTNDCVHGCRLGSTWPWPLYAIECYFGKRVVLYCFDCLTTFARNASELTTAESSSCVVFFVEQWPVCGDAPSVSERDPVVSVRGFRTDVRTACSGWGAS